MVELSKHAPHGSSRAQVLAAVPMDMGLDITYVAMVRSVADASKATYHEAKEKIEEVLEAAADPIGTQRKKEIERVRKSLGAMAKYQKQKAG